MPSVALVTCRDLPAGDEDAELLNSALADRGVDAQWLVWDDADQVWTHDLAVIRSTWDYTQARDAFLSWARGVERLANPVDVLVWNSDKTYLRDLEAAGVPIVATSFAAPGEAIECPAADEVIVKPSVGAGSKGAGRFRGPDFTAAREHAAMLHAAGRTVLVQPYLAEVDVTGETALIYIDGLFSHAVTKGAMLPAGTVNPLDPGFSHSLFVEERITPTDASDAELAVGQRAMTEVSRRFGAPLLYARVDLLPSRNGPVLVELELTEPSLFLAEGDGAAERFAAAIGARA
jgi:glutathione synthase/RimK-type ligase-like ATP-grasp enzyme